MLINTVQPFDYNGMKLIFLIRLVINSSNYLLRNFFKNIYLKFESKVIMAKFGQM